MGGWFVAFPAMENGKCGGDGRCAMRFRGGHENSMRDVVTGGLG